MEAAPPALVGFCEILHSLVTKDDSCILLANDLGMPVEHFLQMDLDVFVRVAITVANVFQAIAKWRPTNRKYTQVVEAIPEMAQAFTNWPKNFERFCKKWHDNPSMRMRDDGFQAKFDWLFVRLHKNLHDRAPQTKFMLEAACGYGTRKWDSRPILIKNKHIDPENLPQPRFGSANAAAKLLGVDPITAARWAASGRIVGTKCGKSTGRNWCIDLDAIRQMKFSAHKRVGWPNAARELKISVATLAEIRKTGNLEPRHFIVGKAGGLAREDLDEFKLDLMGKCKVPVPGMETIPLLTHLYWKSPCQQAEIVNAILSGEIPAYGESVNSIEKMCIEKIEKEKPLPKIETKPVTHLNQAMAIRRFDLHKYEAEAIFRRLGCRKRRKGMDDVEIPKIERFLDRHIVVRKLAAEYGLWSLQLIRALRRLRPSVLISLAPRKGQEMISAYLISKKNLDYAKGVARRLARKIANGKS